MATSHVDVLIIGAGLSGIGAAYHLTREFPERTYAILEARDAHRRHVGPVPLPGRALGLRHVHARLPLQAVDGREGDRRRALDPRLRARDRRASTASTSTSASTTGSTRRGVVERRRALDGHRASTTAPRSGHLPASCSCCARLLRLRPRLHARVPGHRATTTGTLVHPQHWPEDLDYAGKRVVVIGSGATAVTLVPAMAETRRARDDAAALADLHPARCPAATRSPTSLRRLLPQQAAYELDPLEERRVQQSLLYKLSRARPQVVRKMVRSANVQVAARGLRRRHALHARRYDPWDQRLCVVPDGDLFQAIRRARPRSSPTRSRTFTQGRAAGVGRGA